MTDKLVSLAGSVPRNRHKRIGDANPTEQFEVTIKLRRKSERGLPTLDQFIAGKRSPGMTRQQLAEKHGARREDLDAVQLWAKGHGLSVSRFDLGRRQVHLVGSLKAMSEAFDVKISLYEHSRTHTRFRCPEDNIRIPERLVPIIKGVFGLNDMPVVVRHKARTATKSRAAADPQSQWPGTFYPQQVAQLYNFPPQKGNGQKVAILEFGGGFDQSVLADYFTNTIGLPTPPTVNQIPVLNTPIQVDNPITGEVYLDIEVVGAIASQATIDVYFAPFTGDGYMNAIDQAIQNDDYAAISISYGLDEDLAGSATDPGWPMLNQNVDAAFSEAIAVGIPVFVSSGDEGSSSLRDDNDDTLYSKTTHVGYPASSPYATAVGGTMLYAENGAISNEVVWNELGALVNHKLYVGGATGGGASDRYPVPSYQSSAGLNPQSVNTPPKAGRGVPDVSANAGASTGFLVSQPPGSQFPIAPVGGTSAAAPLWAALMACVREALASQFAGHVPVYVFNDFVYAKGTSGAFRDIVGGRQITYDASGNIVVGQFIPTGNNRSTLADGYYAAEGFDLCTGWGSPNGAVLLQQLISWLPPQSPS